MKSFYTFCFLIIAAFQSQAQTFTVVAEGLRSPCGLEFDAQNRLWVVETGYGFNDGAVSMVNLDGTLTPVIAGLTSLFDTVEMESVGAWHTQLLPGNQIAVTSAASGEVLTFDLSGFTPGAPLTPASATSSLQVFGYALGQGFLESNPYSVASGPNGSLLIADAAANAIHKADAAGNLSTVATFSATPNPLPIGPPAIDRVPTRILARPGGGYYVCFLTGFPFLEGAAGVMTLTDVGMAAPFAQGLTMLTDLALDPLGQLYALQFGAFDLSVFNFAPESGRVTRIHADGTLEVVAAGLNLSPGMAFDADGNLYITELATGRILRLDGVSTGTHGQEFNTFRVALAPNPAATSAEVAFTIGKSGPVQISVIDAGGRMVYHRQYDRLEAGDHTETLSVAAYRRGVYWLDVRTASGTRTQKLLVP